MHRASRELGQVTDVFGLANPMAALTCLALGQFLLFATAKQAGAEATLGWMATVAMFAGGVPLLVACTFAGMPGDSYDYRPSFLMGAITLAAGLVLTFGARGFLPADPVSARIALYWITYVPLFVMNAVVGGLRLAR